MSAIPQIECTGSRYIEFSRFTVNTNNQIMNITASPEAEPTLTWNGTPYQNVPGAIINTIPGLAGWTAITMPNSALQQNNIITSEGFFHAGFLTGTNATGTYGYLSGFNDAFEFLDPVTMLPTTIYTVATLCPGETIDHCLIVFSCADDHNIIDVQGNTGNVVVTPPTTPFDTCFTYTAPFNYMGGDTITFTVDNRFGFSGSIDVVFVVADPDTPIDAGPMQQLCGITEGTLPALNPDLLVPGMWTLVSGSGTITNPTSPSTSVTGLSLGDNVFQWTQDYGCQVNTALTQIIVYDGNVPDADAGPDAELCSDDTSYLMQANDPGTTATGTWSITQGSGIIQNINNPNTLVSNLGIGENVFMWELNNGPCDGGVKVDHVSLFVFDVNHPDADAGPDQTFCSDAFSAATLSANPALFPATGQWSVVSGSGSFTNPLARETTVTGLSMGVNVFEWAIDNGPCGILTDTVTITLYDASVDVANAGSNQSWCTPVTSAILNAVEPTGPGFGTWSIVSGAGTFSNPNDASATVSNLPVGTTVLRWTIDNGPCAATDSFDEITITIFDNNLAPANAGQNQQLCVVEITDTPLNAVPVPAPASGVWSVLSGDATVLEPENPASLVAELSLGTNTFQWTVDNGPCAPPSTATVTITVFNDDLPEANAGPDVSFCTPTSTYTMQAIAPASPAMGQWSLVSGTGTISNVNNANANISGLGIGANVFRWTHLNGPCPGKVDFDEMTIFIFDENALVANAGPDQLVCSNPATSLTVTLSGNAPIFPASGQWSLVSGEGTITNSSSATTTVTDLAVGENIFRWTLDNGPCAQAVSIDDVSIFVYDLEQQAANAGHNQQLCSDNASTSLAANPVIFPATGTWVLVSGQGSIAEPNNPNTEISGLAVGQNVFEWTINNGPCAGGSTSDQVIITVFEGALSPANAGMDQTICSSTSSLALNGNPPLAPATGSWSLVSGSATITNPSLFNTTVTNLTPGENTFMWTVNNGPCSGFTTDEVTITVYDATAPVANAGSDQFVCLPQNEVTMNATPATIPGSGSWSLVSGSGSFTNPNDPNTLVTGLTVGLNTFRWAVNNGPCAPSTTNDLVDVFVFDNNQTIAAGADQQLCTPVASTSLNATPPIFPATGQWALVSGSGTLVNPASPSTAVTGLGLGNNVFEWTITNGPCDPSQLAASVTITVFNDNQPGANAGPDLELCTPDDVIAMAANGAVAPATGQWALISGTATIDSPNDPNTTVSNLTVGTVVLQWTISNGPCGPPSSSDFVTIRVYDADAAVAHAGNSLEFCQPAGTVTLSANAAVPPATGLWTLVSGSGIIANPSNPTTTVNGLGVGNNVLQWTITNGQCGGQTSDQITLSVFAPTAPVANAGPDQNLCTPEVSTLLAGNAPQVPGSGFWALESGSGDILNPASPTSAIDNLAIGENIFRWTIANGPCGNTSDLVSIFVFDGGAPQADAGTEVLLCTPENNVILNASPAVDPGVGTWTIVNGTGTIINPNDPNTEITNLGVGINIFAWTLDYATCGTQEDFVSVIVYDASIAPANAGSDQQLCTPVDFTNLNANGVALPAIGTWTLLSGNGDIVNANNPTTLVENLGPGENIFVWTIYNGNCLAEEDRTDTVSIFVFNGELDDAIAGPDQSLCTPNTSAQLSGSPINGAATGLWTLIQGGGILANPTNPNASVSDLPVGENIFVWTVNNGTCDNGITTDTVSIFVFDENQTPANAGPDQELCTPVNAVTLAGNAPTFPATGTWTLISGSGTIADPANPTSLVTNLAPGENIFRWRILNGPCGSFTQDFVSIFIYNQFNADADAGPDQELCAPTFSTSLQGNNPQLPAGGTWTLISGSGTITGASNPNSPVTGLAIGENVFVWTVDNGPCANGITADTVSIFVFDPAAPLANAGPDQSLCTPTPQPFLRATRHRHQAWARGNSFLAAAPLLSLTIPILKSLTLA